MDTYFKHIPIHQVLFFDVETVSQHATYDQMSDNLKKLWNLKHEYIRKNEEETADQSYRRIAAVYAEFGKIVCISCGIMVHENGQWRLRIKSFYGDDEKEILRSFAAMLQANYYDTSRHFLCGHNIKEFDIPYVCRRLLVNGIELPGILDVHGKKPWEVAHIDTMQLWRFGDYKNYTSLQLLAAVFDIPTPKDDIDGSMVGTVYWEEKDVQRIAEYCQKDVLTVVRLLQCYRSEPIIQDEQIVTV